MSARRVVRRVSVHEGKLKTINETYIIHVIVSPCPSFPAKVVSN